MTKAERIFKETRYQCMVSINNWGYDEVGFNNVCTDESISTRTLNDMEKIYERTVKRVKDSYRLGVIDKEKATAEAQILRKVRLTMDNARQALK